MIRTVIRPWQTQEKLFVSILFVERMVVASKATFVKTWWQVVVHNVLSNFSIFFQCLTALCIRKIKKLSSGITAMTEAVFSDVGPPKLSSRSCADGVHVEKNENTLLSALPEKDDPHVPAVTGGTSGISPFLELLVITPRPHALFHLKSPWFHHADGALPAGHKFYQRRDIDQDRLGWTEKPLKSQLSHIFENGKWIRLQHHVFSPLEQRNRGLGLGLGAKLPFQAYFWIRHTDYVTHTM